MNAWQRLVYATVYALATAWLDAQKASLRGVEEYPMPDDLRRADNFRASVLRARQPGDPGRDDPASVGKPVSG